MARPGLDRHVKFRRLVRMLEEPRPHVRGYLELLWEVAYENGDPVIGDAEAVEAAAEYPGEPGKLFRALLACGGDGRVGFIEEADDEPGQFQVHDLHDHAPGYVANRAARETERRKPKVCEHCGTDYRSPDYRSKYCSELCRKAHWRDGRGRTATDASVKKTDRDATHAPAPAPAPAPAHQEDISPSADTDPAGDGAYSATFEEFWRPAIAKEAKRDAAKAYDNAVKLIAKRFSGDKDKARTWLLERWTLYNASPKARSEYSPYPSTWLNGGRYDDDEKQWQRTGSSNGNGKPVRQDSPARIR